MSHSFGISIDMIGPLTHWARDKMAAILANDSFKCIFLNENVLISINISLMFVPKGPINNNPALGQLITWRRPDDKLLSEPMMIILLTHICVTRPQWVNYDLAILGGCIHIGILTHCVPTGSCGATDLGQYWLRCWIVAWKHQPFILSSVDLSSVRFFGIHPRASSQQVPALMFYITCLKFIYLKSLPHPSGVNKFSWSYQQF